MSCLYLRDVPAYIYIYILMVNNRHLFKTNCFDKLKFKFYQLLVLIEDVCAD